MTKIVTSSWRPFLWIEAITLRSSLFSKVNHEFPVTPPAILWDAEDPFEIRIWNKVRGSQCPHQTLAHKDPLPIVDQGLAPPNGSIRLLPLIAHFADEETELERLNDFTRFLQLACGRAWAWTQEIWSPSWDSSCGLSSGVLPGCLIWTLRC